MVTIRISEVLIGQRSTTFFQYDWGPKSYSKFANFEIMHFKQVNKRDETIMRKVS